jgi:hypothetical protein
VLVRDPAFCYGAVRHHATGDAQRAGKVYRGSRRRLRQIRLRGNASVGLWLLIAWVLFLLLVVVPWMIRQGHGPH